MPNLSLAYQPSKSARHVVIENLGPEAGTPAQDRYTIWVVIDRRKGSARPVGSSRVGFNNLDEAIRRCNFIEANMAAPSGADLKF